MKIILSKKFVKYFLICFSIFFTILLTQLLIKFSDDIFNKGLPSIDIVKFICFSSISLIGLCLFFSFLIASIFSFRFYSINYGIKFKNELLSGGLLVTGLSIIYFAFNNWIIPNTNLEMTKLLYEMRSTAPGEKIQRVDKDLFKDYHSSMTIKDINLKIDTFNIRTGETKHMCDSILALLPDSIARKEYNSLKLENYGIVYNSSKNDSLMEMEIMYSCNYLRSYQDKLNHISSQKKKYIDEKLRRITLPIELILLYIIGASFGYYYYDQKSFLLLILGLYTTSFFYGTAIGFERLISSEILGSKEGAIISMMILAIITSIFLIMGLRKERNISNPNK